MSRRVLEILAFCVAILIAALVFRAWLASHDDQVRLQSTLAVQKQVVDAADARERERNASLKDTLAQIETLKRQIQTPEQILRELPKYLRLPQPITMSSASIADDGVVPSRDPPGIAGSTDANQQGTAVSARQGSSSLAPLLPPGSPTPPPNNTSGRQPPIVSTSSPLGSNASEKTHLPNQPGIPLGQNRSQVSPAPPVAEIPTADLKPLYDFVQDCRSCQAQLTAARLDAADNALKIGALTHERDAAITAAKGGGFWLRLRRNAVWLVVGAAASASALCASGHCR